MNALRQIGAILHKDLLLELRSKDVVTTMLIFSLTVVVIFNFVFEPGSAEMMTTAPAILWVAFAFAGNLGLGRSFAREQENSQMHGLLLCPVDRSAIYAAKMAGNFLFITIVEWLTLPLVVVFFDLTISNIWWPLLATLVLGTLGFSAVGTIFSAISANTRAREVMLPILLFPVSVPVILASIKATSYLFAGRAMTDVWSWLRLLIAFDVIYFIVCFLLYEYVIEE